MSAHLHGDGKAGIPARRLGREDATEIILQQSGNPTLSADDLGPFDPDRAAKGSLVWLGLGTYGSPVLVDAKDLREALDLLGR